MTVCTEQRRIQNEIKEMSFLPWIFPIYEFIKIYE